MFLKDTEHNSSLSREEWAMMRKYGRCPRALVINEPNEEMLVVVYPITILTFSFTDRNQTSLRMTTLA